MHSEGINDKGANRQVPAAHGRKVPSKRYKRYDRKCPQSSVAWTLVLSWRLGSGVGGAAWGRRAAPYEPRRDTWPMKLKCRGADVG